MDVATTNRTGTLQRPRVLTTASGDACSVAAEIAAKVAAAAGNFTASNGADKLIQGKLKDQFAESFPKAAIDNIRWYPAVPAGLEEIEGKVLDRLKAGS